jgi:PQQ-dependent dehydrogenase (methanol/ethanol family)
MRARNIVKGANVGGLLCLTAVLSGQSSTQLLKPGSNADFVHIGGGLYNQRHSTLTQINKSNISRLGAAWMVHPEGTVGQWMQGTPVIVNGTMYMSTGHIWARDARTGALKWRYPNGPINSSTTNFNRGVAVAEGKVFSAAAGRTLLALDQYTGAVIWKKTIASRGNTNAPAIYHDGLVFMGVGGGESGVRGQFGAYDAKDGREVWKFWTVPGPGEVGHETWEGDSWKYGGAPVWTHPAIDRDLGLIYFATGNAAPDNDGTRRGGDNLFSASIVALDIRSGRYKWHFQEVHHDIWDYDAPVAPVLADITYQGQNRKILMHGGKTGMMYILDRTNGKPLIGIVERPVEQEPRMKTARTQPFPIGDVFVPICPEPGSVPPGMRSGCVFTPYYDIPTAIAPGTDGGLSWAPMSYSPQTKLIYVCGSIVVSGHEFRLQLFNETTGRLFTPPGTRTGRGFFGLNYPQPRGGTVTAMDPTRNKIVWQKRLPWPCGSGSGFLSTASGLLFHGESDGHLVVHDASNGDVLWKFQTGAGADAPVATYEIAGEQYIAILSGGNQYMKSAMGDNLWAFKLGGTLPQAAAPPLPGPKF